VPFNPQSPELATHDFVQHFTEAFGSEPDAFAAYAHDAYRLVRSAVEAGQSRASAGRALRVQRANGLVAPAQGFDANREPLRAVEVLELHGTSFDDVTAK